MVTVKQAMSLGYPIYLFGCGRYNSTITLTHDGEWVKAVKDTDKNKEYHFNMRKGKFYCVFHHSKEDKWVDTEKITSWFGKSEIITYDKKFAKLVLFNRKSWHLHLFTSPARFIEALSSEKCSRFEQWEALGIELKEIKEILEAENEPIELMRYYNRTFSSIDKKPKEINKGLLHFIQSQGEINIDTLNNYTSSRFNLQDHKDMIVFKKFLQANKDVLTVEEARGGYRNKYREEHDYSKSNRFVNKMFRICKEYNIKWERLIEYIDHLKMYEHTYPSWLENNYEDYLKAELKMRGGKKRKMTKYPLNLVQAHHNRTEILIDIEIEERLLEEQKIKEQEKAIYADNQSLKYVPKQSKYCIIVPKDGEDVIQEGKDMNHCVGSYCSSIRKGRTFIVFMREQKTPKKSLITVEIKDDTIKTALGKNNRLIRKEEKEFLKQFAKAKGLTMGKIRTGD